MRDWAGVTKIEYKGGSLAFYVKAPDLAAWSEALGGFGITSVRASGGGVCLSLRVKDGVRITRLCADIMKKYAELAKDS